jgi:SAM-dependent methyltransferase
LNALSTATEAFGPIAPYYDELMRGVPYRMWTGYYLLLLSHQGVRPKKLLEVCCGTGTLCEMLYDEGFTVAGFDISPGMIEAARKKARKANRAIRYEVDDARTFDMGEPFEAAFSFFDSLNNLLEPAELLAAFRRVAAHLPPGGSFVFDLNTAYAFEQRMFDQKELAKNRRLRYDWVGHYDPATRNITVEMDFWYRGEAFHETHVQHAYQLDEVFEMLDEAEFTDVKVFDSYTLNPPRVTADRWHFMARRA